MDLNELKLERARPAFVELTDAAVWRAVEHAQDGPIAAEVTRLAVDFMIKLMAYMRENNINRLPADFMKNNFECPIERVAIAMALKYIESETGVYPFER